MRKSMTCSSVKHACACWSAPVRMWTHHARSGCCCSAQRPSLNWNESIRHRAVDPAELPLQMPEQKPERLRGHSPVA